MRNDVQNFRGFNGIGQDREMLVDWTRLKETHEIMSTYYRIPQAWNHSQLMLMLETYSSFREISLFVPAKFGFFNHLTNFLYWPI